MPQRKILVVEDDFILYDELREFFEEKGFTVIENEEGTAVDNYEDAVRLVKAHKPDIALLDIRIRGDKDGIDIGTFIKRNYHIPVIYLSAFPNPENLERIRQAGDERFMFKATKPVNKEQLWSMVFLALPQADKAVKEKSIGRFFSLKEVQVKNLPNHQQVLTKQPDEPLEIETFLKWEDIVYIESYNKKQGGGNNNVLIHTTASDKAYVLRSPLSELEEQVPAHFARFDQSYILNLHKITGRIRGTANYLIGDKVFRLSNTYRDRAEGKDFPPFE